MDGTDFGDFAWLSKEEEMLREHEQTERHPDECWRDALLRSAIHIILKTS